MGDFRRACQRRMFLRSHWLLLPRSGQLIKRYLPHGGSMISNSSLESRRSASAAQLRRLGLRKDEEAEWKLTAV